MSESILHDFYFGNIRPAERKTIPNSDAHRLVHTLTDAEKKLRQSLMEEQTSLLDSFLQVQSECDCLFSEEEFLYGFRTGSRMMLEMLRSESQNFKEISE